jgi:hypothetical protein
VLNQFLSGAAMLGAWTGGVFFFRFWYVTRDRLFLIFGIAFLFMALERGVLALLNETTDEDHSAIYLIRLTAFLLILFAIIDKNRKERKFQR